MDSLGRHLATSRVHRNYAWPLMDMSGNQKLYSFGFGFDREKYSSNSLLFFQTNREIPDLVCLNNVYVDEAWKKTMDMNLCMFRFNLNSLSLGCRVCSDLCSIDCDCQWDHEMKMKVAIRWCLPSSNEIEIHMLCTFNRILN